MAYGNTLFTFILQHLNKLKHIYKKTLLDANFFF